MDNLINNDLTTNTVENTETPTKSAIEQHDFEITECVEENTTCPETELLTNKNSEQIHKDTVIPHKRTKMHNDMDTIKNGLKITSGLLIITAMLLVSLLIQNAIQNDKKTTELAPPDNYSMEATTEVNDNDAQGLGSLSAPQETIAQENNTESETQNTEPSTPPHIVQAQTVVNSTVADIVENILPSMVSIETTYTYKEFSIFFGEQSYEATASGSGIVFRESDNEVLVLTNAHVIKDANTINLTFSTKEVVPGIVKDYDSETDLAVVAIKKDDIPAETANKIKFVKVGNSDLLRLGEPVIAIGNCLGYGQTVTTGVISGLDRKVPDEEGTERTMIQTDAAINPGNSGGALLNMNGELIGINESKIANSYVDGVGFAIPITSALEKIEMLSAVETREVVDADSRGVLGIMCIAVSSEAQNVYGIPTGAYITELTENGGADKAGMHTHDVVTKINNRKVSEPQDVINELAFFKEGDTVEIEYLRNVDGEWKSFTVQVILGSKNEITEDPNIDEKEETEIPEETIPTPTIPGETEPEEPVPDTELQIF